MLSIMTPAYIDTPPGVVVGARISTEVLAPVIKKPIPACSVWIWVSETWVGLFWPESKPALHPGPLQTTMSALGTSVAVAAEPVIPPTRDFNREKPVSDALFQVYKSLYSYDRTPLHAAVESTEETDDWKREKITFAAAYGNERVIAYLFLPKKSRPPCQTVGAFSRFGNH